jgi:hypothetical protein
MNAKGDNTGHAMKDMALGIAGGILGGCLGYFLFSVVAKQGFYAIILPGALLGMGCGSLSGRKSLSLGIACAIGGLLLGIITEWHFAPFIKDKSFSFFLSHLHQLTRISRILILVGSFLAFWFGRGRDGGAWLRKQPASPTDTTSST